MYNNEDLCFPKRFMSILLLAFTILILLFNVANEYNYANFSKELRPLLKNAIPVSCIPLEENNGKLIHINCPLQDLETFYAPAEFSSNIYSYQGVFFETKIEMYQWIRDRSTLGLFTRAKFVDHVVPTPYNFLLFHKKKKNPSYMPNVGSVGRRYANYAKVGNYRLPKESLINFQRKKKLDVVDDGWFTESLVKPPFTINHLNTKVFNNYLYTGDPINPQIGDVRISFYGNAASHSTVVGVQKTRLLNTIFEIEGININNKNVLLVSEDNKTIHDQMNDFIYKNYGNKASLWMLRIVTCILILVQAYYALNNSTRNSYWKFGVSFLISLLSITVFPCLIWFFCDISIFLFLFIMVFLILIALLFLFNLDTEDGYTEMKNYMRKPGASAMSNFTFSNMNDPHNVDGFDDHNLQRTDANTLFGSSSEVSYSQPLNIPNDHNMKSSPVYIYQKTT